MKFVIALVLAVSACLLIQTAESQPFGMRRRFFGALGPLGAFGAFGAFGGLGGFGGFGQQCLSPIGLLVPCVQPFGLPGVFGKRETEEKPFCKFMRTENSTTLKCSDHKTTVECEAFEEIGLLNAPISLFSISAEPKGDLKKDFKSVTYDLFMQMAERNDWNATYVDPIDNKIMINFSLYFEAKPERFGLRINSSECFEKMTTAFTGFPTTMMKVNFPNAEPKEMKVIATIEENEI